MLVRKEAEVGSTAAEKYVFKPFPGSSHVWALAELAALPPAASVLDVGPGSGFIGAALRERGITELYAVEVDERAAAALSPIYRRIESELAAYTGMRFDVLLLLDVLEHMTNPQAFLDAALPLLAPGGTLLVSVPNVAHWSVRLPLLLGFFEYTSRGILDRTHYRFFTRQSFKRLLNRPELAELRLSGSISPLELALPGALYGNAFFRICSRIRMAAARLAPGLCAYQHLATARKKA